MNIVQYLRNVIFYCNNNLCFIAYLLVVWLRICNRNAVDIWTKLKLSFVTYFFFLGTFNYIFLHQITICSSYYESCDIRVWKKWYWSVWPVRNFEDSSFFRNDTKFYQSTDISHKFSIFIRNAVKSSKLLHFLHLLLFNRRGYYSDQLYENSKKLRKVNFLSDYSGHLFSYYTAEVLFHDRTDDPFFVVWN
jgi:hypothetical protein